MWHWATYTNKSSGVEYLGTNLDEATDIFEDNQGAIVWASDDVRNAKHITIRRNFSKELSDAGTIRLVYMPTADMKADVLAKRLKCVQFCQHRNGISESETLEPPQAQGGLNWVLHVRTDLKDRLVKYRLVAGHRRQKTTSQYDFSRITLWYIYVN